MISLICLLRKGGQGWLLWFVINPEVVKPTVTFMRQSSTIFATLYKVLAHLGLICFTFYETACPALCSSAWTNRLHRKCNNTRFTQCLCIKQGTAGFERYMTHIYPNAWPWNLLCYSLILFDTLNAESFHCICNLHIVSW